jgi:hypothetical protein
MTDDLPSGLRDDWTFHQATGMVSVQIGTNDVEEAARRLIALAAERDETVHDIASLVVARRLRLPIVYAPRIAWQPPGVVSGDGGDAFFQVGCQVTFRGHLETGEVAVTVTVIENAAADGVGRHDLVLRPDTAVDWARLVGILTERRVSVDGHSDPAAVFEVVYLAPIIAGHVTSGGWDDVGVTLVEA